jgi:copper resistance protein C
MTVHQQGAAGGLRSRLSVRVAVLMLLTLAAGIGLAGPAAAHNVLIGSDPADGATLQSAPTTVKLTFDQPVQNFQPVMTVIGPDGQRYESGSPQIDSTVVSTGVNALPVAGAYTIAYRIVSADGHPVQGEVHFSLADGAVAGSGSSSAGGSGDPAATASAAVSAGDLTGPGTTGPTTAATAPAASSTLSGWVWAAIAVAALLVAAAIVVILRRPGEPE